MGCRKAVPRPITIAAMKWPASAPHQLFCLIREFFTQFVNASRCDAGEKGRKKEGKAPDFVKMDFCICVNLKMCENICFPLVTL